RVVSYDARTGSELWSAEGLAQQCIASPVALGERVFVASPDGTLALGLDGTVAWRNRRGKSFIPSPLAYQGHIYIADDRGIVTCLDAVTGKQAWKERLGEQYHASPVAGDGKVYFTSKEGVIRVVAAGPEFRLLAANDMGEPVIASPAISGGEIFIRGQ